MSDLRDAVQIHLLTLSAEGRTVQTQRQYMLYEGAFINWLDGRGIQPSLGELNVQRVSEFLVWYRTLSHPRRVRGGETACRAASDILKRLGSVLETQELLPVNPLRKLKRPRVAKYLRTPFSKVELTALWAACRSSQYPTRDELLYLLLLDTGMRIGEACKLKIEDVDLAARQIRISPETKGRRERLVPIGDMRGGPSRLVRAFQTYFDHRPESPRGDRRVFLNRAGEPLDAVAGSDVIRRLGKTAGVADCYPHRLRHGFCTSYLERFPSDTIGLRRIVGHLSEDVLADYVHISQTTLAQRQGHVAPSDGLVAPRPAPPPTVAPRALPAPVTALRPMSVETLITEMRARLRSDDPELRQALIEALLGGAA